LDCCHYDSNGKPLKTAAGKPAESKKSHKKFEDDKSMAFMQTMFEAYVKAQKACKSKKLRSAIMTLVTVPTVNRELGPATKVLV
jgi:hypothetical protein